MKLLSIDLETYSSVDLKKYGMHKYIDSDDFEIMLFAYAFDDEPIICLDLFWDDIPKRVMDALWDPSVIKTAYNAGFERNCMAKHFGRPMPAKQFSCTMAMGLYNGLPAGLDSLARALRLDLGKDVSGKGLINLFCKPCKPTKKNGFRTRNLPEHFPEDWARFVAYCAQDVRVERLARKYLHPMPHWEQDLWVIDQDMNDDGVAVDMELVRSAVICFDEYEQVLLREARILTGLTNPNSVTQLKKWLVEEIDELDEIESLNKVKVIEILGMTDDFVVNRMLKIRQELGKSSCKKYHMLLGAVCSDGRIHGILQYYGANRTGRYAGRLLQIQNLPKNFLKDLDDARRFLKAGLHREVEAIWDNIPNTISQLIRTTLMPDPGETLLVNDYSAIEARIIAWLAKEQWRIDVFNTHGRIYEASAAAMFKIPLATIGKDSKERQKGKIAELACGYHGGPAALRAMDAKWAATQTEEELREIVTAWRQASPAIVQLWYDMEQAAKTAIRDKTTVPVRYGVAFTFRRGHLYMRLPSGRELVYREAKLEMKEKFGKPKEIITFWGVDQVKKRWCQLDTYSGKLVENCVQAIARDCLVVAISRLTAAGFHLLFHVHDEIVATGPEDDLDRMADIMAKPISWAPGLPLPVDGYATPYYLKA